MRRIRRRGWPPAAALTLALLAAGCGGETPAPPAAPSAEQIRPNRRQPRPLSPQQQQQLQESFQRGIRLLQEGRADEAAGALSIAAGLAPDNPRVLRMLGNAYARSNDLERAEQVLRASLNLDPLEAGTHYELAQVALAMGDLDTALSEGKRTFQLDPRNPKAGELMGLVHYRRGELQAALEALKPATTLDRTRLEGLYIMGLSYQGLERYEEARDAFRGVVERKPDHAEAWFNLGKVLAILGDEDGALAANDKFVEISGTGVTTPDQPEANLPPGVGEP